MSSQPSEAAARRDFVSADDVCAGLRALFPRDSYAVLFNVADGTGGRATRRADALVQSLWPSRGLWLAGVEIKISRGDWLRELKQPAKADAIHRYCDHWYVAVADAAIVKPGELPPGWGLIAPRADKLGVRTPAAQLDPVPMTPTFRAALLRAAQEAGTDRAGLEAARAQGRREGRERAEIRAQANAAGAERELADVRAGIAEVERHVGAVTRWNAADIAAAMVLYRQLRGAGSVASQLARAAADLRSAAARVEGIREAVTTAMGDESRESTGG